MARSPECTDEYAQTNLTWPALSETLIDTEKATGAHTSEADPALLFWCWRHITGYWPPKPSSRSVFASWWENFLAFSRFKVHVIINGWKSIAQYLDCGVRTVQRWERKGLPVSRPVSGHRSLVVVRSEQLDHWIEDRALMRARNGSDLQSSLVVTRKLRHEVKQAREDLQLKKAALRKEMATLKICRHLLIRRKLCAGARTLHD